MRSGCSSLLFTFLQLVQICSYLFVYLFLSQFFYLFIPFNVLNMIDKLYSFIQILINFDNSFDFIHSTILNYFPYIPPILVIQNVMMCSLCHFIY